MSKTSRIATAVAAGYVLGRFKKMRMAVMVGSALANDNVRQSALNLVKQGSGRLGTSGPSKTLTQQVGSKLLDAGKAAAVAAAASRVDAFSDRIAARSESLRGEETDEAEADADEDYEGDEPVDEVGEPTDEADDFDEDAEEEPDEYDEPAEEVQQPTRSRRRGRSASPAR